MSATPAETCPKQLTVLDVIDDFESPDSESRLWQGLEVPHRPLNPEIKKILPNILHQIGLTPLVKLNRIPQSLGIQCDVYAKCEYLNPGGSVKDRIGYRMVLDAEEKGLIREGYTIIEPTSGNTGIGVALACAVRGYRCIIVMAEKNSMEKVDTLQILGAEIIRTPTEAGYLSTEGLFSVSQKLRKEIPNAVILGQYSNPSNWAAHYDGTGSEILWQLDNQIDMVVSGAGTGGTVSGIGKKIKETVPSCKIVSFDPYGSILARPEDMNKTSVTFFEVEGIGYDFIPSVLKHENVDVWYKTGDAESFPMARRLIKEEGLLCGGSSGAAMSVAMKAAKELKAGQKCVVILPDGIRNYMTKFVSDNWMQVRGFMPLENTHQQWWWNDKIEDLRLGEIPVIESNLSCREAINKLKENQRDELPIVTQGTNYLIGIASRATILNKCFHEGIKMEDPITKAMLKKYQKVSEDSNIGYLCCALEKEPFVVVTMPLPRTCSGPKVGIKYIISQAKVLDYISQVADNQNKLNGN